MKTKLIAIVAVASTVIGGGALLATNAMAQTTPQAVGITTSTERERHPEIRKAMKQLNNALNTMQHAADDFGGHKKDAMEHTRKAIAELQAALRFDKH